jgi:alkanesulfonate monooxygenase SsuD/methylene tetrahydromethanopterin reductase-like flavin-dependent oxidoreductase (luciferase family)
MTVFGAFLSTEEHPPLALVDQAVRAEAAGFEALWVSDHYHPWNDAQGHAPFVWSVLGAIAGRTSTVRCTTAVTAPVVRIHPAVVAQAAATTAAMFEGRFSLGVGTGEALNEHILGDAWPTLDVRLEMLEEAGRGDAGAVDRRAGPPPRHALHGRHGPALHAAGRAAARAGVRLRAQGDHAGRAHRDGYLNVDPSAELLQLYREQGGRGPAHGGVKVCWSQDEAEARRTVHRLWAHTAIPGEVGQLLPSPAHFEQISSVVTEEMAVGAVGAVGNRVEDFVEAVRPYVDAGYDEVYLSQIGRASRTAGSTSTSASCGRRWPSCPAEPTAGVSSRPRPGRPRGSGRCRGTARPARRPGRRRRRPARTARAAGRPRCWPRCGPPGDGDDARVQSVLRATRTYSSSSSASAASCSTCSAGRSGAYATHTAPCSIEWVASSSGTGSS